LSPVVAPLFTLALEGDATEFLGSGAVAGCTLGLF
jgi:hypothetical protein